MKIVFLEGLPGIGKTTLINEIRKLKVDNLFLVDEIIKKGEPTSQDFFMENDIKKLEKYNTGTIIIDRGAISTLSYNECLKEIRENKDLDNVYNWFDKNFKKVYSDNNVITIYLTRNTHKHLLRYEDDKDPYGSINNQIELEKITLNNIKKYCKNYKILNIDNYKKEEIVYEIIN